MHVNRISQNVTVLLWLASVRQGQDALISTYGLPFILFTGTNLLLTEWQLAEVFLHTGEGKTEDKALWLKEPWKNVLLAEMAYVVWIQIQMIAVFWVSTMTGPMDYLAYADQHPVFENFVANIAMNTAFFNNLVIFLATLLRYKMLPNPNKFSVPLYAISVLQAPYSVWNVLWGLWGPDGGGAGDGYIQVVMLPFFRNGIWIPDFVPDVFGVHT